MRETRHFTMLTAAAIMLGLAAVDLGAQATPPSFEELVVDADAIFLGRVFDTQPYRDEGPWGRAIVTRVVFAVERMYKGAPAMRTSLEFLGGTIGDTTFKVEAMPAFKEGDRDVLFVKSGVRLVNPIVAAPFGRFRVMRDSRGLDTVTAFNGMPFSAVGGVGPLQATPDGPSMSLQQFELHIAQVLKSGR